jgi:hypothetical protein
MHRLRFVHLPQKVWKPAPLGGATFVPRHQQRDKRRSHRHCQLVNAPVTEEGCGGLTGVTPLLLYRSWIVDTAHKFNSTL